MTRLAYKAGAAALALSAMSSALWAQSLASRVDAVRDGSVQFTFAARQGVCGNGRTYIQTSPGNINGDFYGSVNDGLRSDPCVAGPVRVVVDRASGETIAVKAYVGPVSTDPGVTSLGAVRAQDAADYLLALARTADGRAGRQAILPAMLADSTNNGPALLAIAKNTALPRDTRNSALGWVSRFAEPGASSSTVDAVLAIARDENDNVQVRQQALRTLARFDRGIGIPALVEVARSADQSWMRREALSSLARSGDPRARAVLRETVQSGSASDEITATAIRSLANEYGTASDAQFIRDAFPKLTGERARSAALEAAAEIGGAANSKWLLGIASDPGVGIETRRRALESASRAGVGTAELLKLYDAAGDAQMKDALMSQFARSGDRAAVEKLIAIARTDDNLSVRRRAINQLSRMDDPRVKEALRELIER